MIDNIDTNILTILQNNARTPNAEIARKLDLAPSCIHERIRKLEQRGILAGYRACIDPKKLGFGVTAFLFVRTDDRVGTLNLAQIPEVLEVHHIAGEDCYLVKLRCTDNEDLGRLIREKIGVIEAVKSTRTSVVMETIKEDGALPVGP